MENLTDSLDLLSAIKTGKKPADPVALQTALNAVISLSAEETRNLTESMNGLENLTEEKNGMRAEYLALLDGFRAYLEAAKRNATKEASAEETVRGARQLKEWRDGTYTPGISPVVDFVAVLENKQSIVTAHMRLISIIKDEKKIRGLLAGGKTASFLRLLKKAQGEISRATQLNWQADKLLLAPDADGNRDGETIDATIGDANGLLNGAYDDFAAMSALVKK